MAGITVEGLLLEYIATIVYHTFSAPEFSYRYLTYRQTSLSCDLYWPLMTPKP